MMRVTIEEQVLAAMFCDEYRQAMFSANYRKMMIAGLNAEFISESQDDGVIHFRTPGVLIEDRSYSVVVTIEDDAMIQSAATMAVRAAIMKWSSAFSSPMVSGDADLAIQVATIGASIGWYADLDPAVGVRPVQSSIPRIFSLALSYWRDNLGIDRFPSPRADLTRMIRLVRAITPDPLVSEDAALAAAMMKKSADFSGTCATPTPPIMAPVIETFKVTQTATAAQTSVGHEDPDAWIGAEDEVYHAAIAVACAKAKADYEVAYYARYGSKVSNAA
jgi:hypothetical protein